MTYDEFLSTITKLPTPEVISKVLAYVESADIETLRAALNVSGINPYFIKMINAALQKKISSKNITHSTQSISSKFKNGR